ncbi:hypothetical protein A0J61_10970 [Choanephora cucurbitarum]|uniref:Integrase catalytic domain-containing protein n=1 Tax=Choanephora cucurbitarum TaxID=101091 RepID=A0A1C7MVX1_9FUNG|nr:hypothetical protein A0J61_10970 [Choanephora cucurbitarum]
MTIICARLGIKRTLTSVEHPQTDGLVDRMNRTLKFITFAYNTAKHASTGVSPFQVMFGRLPILLNEEGLVIPEFKTYETETWVTYLNRYIPLLHGNVLQNFKTAQKHQKTFYDKGRRTKYDYNVGDKILRRNLEKTTFPKELWSGPYVIVDKNNAEGTSWKITKIDDPRAHITTANVRHMRPYHDPTTPLEGEAM